MEQATASAAKRSRFFYNLLSPLAGFIACTALKCKVDPIPDINGGYLLLCNHNTDLDMMLMGKASRRHMYFVGSEHIFQAGWAARLLRWMFSPIIRQKGSLASGTVLSITRSLRRGDNVCIFAEGNRSFDGRTCHILPSTAKLAKASGAALVTYKLEKGYLATPRWAYSIRKGRMKGHPVNVYTKEQLAGMSADEVYAAICADLHEDTYDSQNENPIPFKGSRLAEGLEHALYFCPECEKLGRMTAHGSILTCECGMKAQYDEYGRLSGTKFSDIGEWSVWQRRKLGEYLDTPGYPPIRDENASLYRVDPDHRKKSVYSGPMELSDGMLRFGALTFPMAELEGVGICGRSQTVLMYAGAHYEFNSRNRLCALKYVHAYEHITGSRVI